MSKLLSGLSNLLNNHKMSNYTSVSTRDPNEVLRDKLRSKSCNKIANKESTHTDTINTLCLLRPGMVFSGSRDTRIGLTNTDVGGEQQYWDTNDNVLSLAVHHDAGKHKILSGGRNTNINMWMFHNQQPVASFVGHRLPVTGLQYIGDCEFASGSRDCCVKLWDIETKGCVMSETISRNLVTSLSYRGDVKFLAQTSEDKFLRLWDIRNLKVTTKFPQKNHILTCSTWVNDALIYTGSNGCEGDGCEITMYDRRNPKETRVLRGHTQPVTGIATVDVADYRTLLVTISSDKTLKLWRLDTFEAALFSEDIPLETDSFHLCTYSDGHIIVSGGKGRLIHYQVKFSAGRIFINTLWVQNSSTVKYLTNSKEI